MPSWAVHMLALVGIVAAIFSFACLVAQWEADDE